MMLIRFVKEGRRRTVDMRGMFDGRTAILLGGAPSLKEQPYQLLEQRGVLVMAMNNAARLVRPTLWSCGDNPNCYDPMLLLDPTIMKFGPLTWADAKADKNGGGLIFREAPNMFFYIPKDNPPWDEFFGARAEAPWYRNTLMVSIYLLYQMGVRRIILAGSDFMSGKDGDYAHGQQLGDLQKKWNLDLYNHLVRELRLLKPIFDKAGLELLDSSKNSRLSQVYKHITLERAVELCLEGFPSEMVPPDKLPHCSDYAPNHIKEAIAEWPGHDKNDASNPQKRDTKAGEGQQGTKALHQVF